MTNNANQPAMPDAQKTQGDFGALKWVGMSNIALQLQLGKQAVAARADIHVNLIDDRTRGIHMSRLYRLLDQFADGDLTPRAINQLLCDCVHSQQQLSTNARLRLHFDYLRKAPALISNNSGWRAYPIVIEAITLDSVSTITLQIELVYSSTCPSSAALARQVIQQRFLQHFERNEAPSKTNAAAWLLNAEGGSAATAHAQRSTMQIRVPISTIAANLDFEVLISKLEFALQTPVQTAVKREDEQAFTERNGANLMFVEDALRRAKQALTALGFTSAHVSAQHLESLHAHDATGEISW